MKTYQECGSSPIRPGDFLANDLGMGPPVVGASSVDEALNKLARTRWGEKPGKGFSRAATIVELPKAI
jgi:hypothetical protein